MECIESLINDFGEMCYTILMAGSGFFLVFCLMLASQEVPEKWVEPKKKKTLKIRKKSDMEKFIDRVEAYHAMVDDD